MKKYKFLPIVEIGKPAFYITPEGGAFASVVKSITLEVKDEKLIPFYNLEDGQTFETVFATFAECEVGVLRNVVPQQQHGEYPFNEWIEWDYKNGDRSGPMMNGQYVDDTHWGRVKLVSRLGSYKEDGLIGWNWTNDFETDHGGSSITHFMLTSKK